MELLEVTDGHHESIEVQWEANNLHCMDLELTEWLVVALEETAVVAKGMAAQEEHFLDVME